MPAKVYVDETEVVPLLTKMLLPRYAMLEILTKIAGERANVAPTDPPSATGYETWRWGTRYCREEEALIKNGWKICEKNQISGISHEGLKIKLAVCSTDSNTGNPHKNPKNLTLRGPANCRLIDSNSTQGTFEFIKEDAPPYDLWYFCPFFCETYISAEISRPTSQAAGIITSFSERIIIAQPWEIPGIRRPAKLPDDFAVIPVPKIRRK